jgi:nucleoside-diphosphate-sugar epimerase
LSDKNKFVLVTGATGAVGPQVVRALYQAGYQIRTFSVDTPVAGMFPQDVEILFGDATNKDAVQSAMQEVDAVVHMAALLHVVNPVPGLREKYEHVNVGGTATVVETAIKASVKRVVLFSTIAVYGASDGCVFNEMSPTHPKTIYAQTKLAAEEIVLNARRADGGSIGTVLRLGAVYGSRIKGNYERMVRAIARNRFIPIGDGLNRRMLVYDKDVARAAVLAVEHPAAAGRVYNVTDGKFHTLNEIILAICKALGRKPPHFSLPVAPVRFAAGILEDGARLCGCRSPITRATIDKYTEDIAAESIRIQKELDFVPQYDLDTGWQETIQEMREQGIL